MDRSTLKTYAIQARRDCIQAVTDSAAKYGLTAKHTEPITEEGDVALIGGLAFPRSITSKRKALEERITRQGFEQTMEAMAYTWFNRLVAIRYMELHGYVEHGYRVLSHPEGKSTPEVLEHAEHLDLPGLDKATVIDLKLDGAKENELYRMLVIAQCNALHRAMPFLFEPIDDETELLLPDNLLHSDSLVRKLVHEIPEEDWQEVEIIGWLYQFYISEKKDQVIGKVVKPEDIPAATQLFTPNWIVKYMVQNSLGAQWLATYPDSKLKGQMEYYIEPAEQTDEVKAQLKAITPTNLNPEELTLLDPACGSGHILVEAYDLFKAIYQERGYRAKDIPRLILEKNLYGLEIDDRATQLAAFALMMKARSDDRTIFAAKIQPQVLAIQESKGLDAKEISEALNAPILKEKLPPPETLFEETEKERTPLFNKDTLSVAGNIKQEDVAQLIDLFEHGKTFGSLLRVPETLVENLPYFAERVNDVFAHGGMFEKSAARLFSPIVEQARILGGKYDTVVANPPYMGGKHQTPILKQYLKEEFKGYDKDFFSAFIVRAIEINKPAGRLGVVTPFVWMFLSSYNSLREKIVKETTLTSLIQLEYNAFEPACIPVAAFTMDSRHVKNYTGSYIKLSDFKGHMNQAPKTLEAIQRPDCGWFYEAKPDDFKKIPGSPIAYSLSKQTCNQFSLCPSLSTFGTTRLGMTTANNDLFTRLWCEIRWDKFSPSAASAKEIVDQCSKWVPYNKGGAFRKWFGNMDFVLNWSNDGSEIKHYGEEQGHVRSTVPNEDFYFRECLTWSKISSSNLAMRYRPNGSIFDVAGACIFGTSDNLHLIHGFANSAVCMKILQALSPTLNFEGGQISLLPIVSDAHVRERSINLVPALVRKSREDWNAYERSWDFESLPLLSGQWLVPSGQQETKGKHPEKLSTHHYSLATSYTAWLTHNRETIAEMKRLEEENNRLFIDAYGLADELTPDVPIEQITLTVNPAYRYGKKVASDEWSVESGFGEELEARFRQDTMQELISYAIGCMMGRYSLDKPGLIYAHSGNQGFDPSQYQIFPADDDGIIPITDYPWFEDDAANRLEGFIATAWAREHLEENLSFLAEGLGSNRNEQPRDTIRRYLATGFYKHHLSLYKKRPIYWLFSSGKQRGFQCLVYLHRYHEGTLARMRTEYVIPLLGKIAARMDHLDSDVSNVTSTSHLKKLEKERDLLRKHQTELQAFDEKLRHYADQRISLDLDDGVKVNYGKFGNLLADVKKVTGGTDD